MTKFQQLCEIEGLETFEDLEPIFLDSVHPGICMNTRCDYTCHVEPDCREGWCEECATPTVKALGEFMIEGETL